MKFIVTRTSQWDDEKPCENAKLNNEVNLWDDKQWYIEINTIEELMAFKREVGVPIIIRDNSIEIYDDKPVNIERCRKVAKYFLNSALTQNKQ